MTDCRNCKNKDNCVYACERINLLNDYDSGIVNDDYSDPYNMFDGCDDYYDEV